MAGFVHLHVHTEYSLLDGACRIERLVQAAAGMGMPALAVTDHGVMYGVVDFYKAAKKYGLNPIIGCEVYVANRTRHDRTPRVDDSPAHLVLLAQNEEGYRNLLQLVSRASLEGFYYKPRVDRELLGQYHGGLVALSACLAGEIPACLMAGDQAGARRLAGEYRDIFGPEHFFLELQDHGIPEQVTVNRELVRLSGELRVPLVATNDVHYVMKDQARIHDVLLCIQTGKTIEDDNRLRFSTQEFYLKSEEEMMRLFGEVPEAITNTTAIAEQCRVEFQFGKLYLPDYRLPDNYTSPYDYLRYLCEQGLRQRYSEVTEEISGRLDYELRVIREMGYEGYFLIVWDLINFARSRGIPVGPGRGSAAGSLVAYALGITNIDPLRYNLLFERFLNPERVTMPDIDSDFCFERRGEVIEYVTQKYGSDHVAQIITFGTMLARAAVRDVGRAVNMPLAEVDRVAKLIPNELGISIARAQEITPELRQACERDDRVRQLLDLAGELEGTPRHASTHAAGVVISQEPLTHYLPVQKMAESGVATQFTMQVVEEIGLLKMDVLGLRTLTVIGDAVGIIGRVRGETVDIDHLPLDDAATYQLLGSAESTGVFQLESSGMRTILKNMRPERFEDLVALVALYRPGPLGSGMVEDFIKRKHGATDIKYPHPVLEPILRETYGVILYQEQVMRIASDLAGFTLGQADLLRRAMGKKKPEIIMAQRAGFISGAVSRGVEAATAGEIFDLMEYFAGYGFNKSHSAAYAMVAYQTAFLKAHYPVEFLAALLTSVMDHADKVPVYIDECRRLGIQVLPPDINESLVTFTVVEGKIRFGLAAVKNVGRGAIEAIISARDDRGKFTSLQDFCERVDLRVVNKRVIESLIRCGAFASTGNNRAQLLAVLDRCVDSGQKVRDDREQGQLSLLDLVLAGATETAAAMEVPEVSEVSLLEILAMEKELLGFYVSGHPVREYAARLAALTDVALADLAGFAEERAVTVGGIITSLRRQPTKKGEMMAYVMLEDTSAVVEVLVFPGVYSRCSHLLAVDRVCLARGRVNTRDDSLKFLAENIERLPELGQPEMQVYLHPRRNDRASLEELRDILRQHPGQSPVRLYFRTGQCLAAGPEYRVEITRELKQAVEKVCGAGSVRVAPGKDFVERQEYCRTGGISSTTDPPDAAGRGSTGQGI